MPFEGDAWSLIGWKEFREKHLSKPFVLIAAETRHEHEGVGEQQRMYFAQKCFKSVQMCSTYNSSDLLLPKRSSDETLVLGGLLSCASSLLPRLRFRSPIICGNNAANHNANHHSVRSEVNDTVGKKKKKKKRAASSPGNYTNDLFSPITTT